MPDYVIPIDEMRAIVFERVGDPIVGIPAPDSPRVAAYRAEVRETMRQFSDAALAYQDARIIGGIDREECNREMARRARGEEN